MCDMCGKACFILKSLYKGANHGLWTRVKKQSMETHWLSVKQNVQCTAVSKEGLAGSVLGHIKTHHY